MEEVPKTRGGQTVEQFVEAVNVAFDKLMPGSRVGDLNDFPTYREWKSGTTPEAAAQKAVEYAGSEEYQQGRQSYINGMGMEDDEE